MQSRRHKHRPPHSPVHPHAAQPPRPPAAKQASGLRTDWGQVAHWYDKLVGESGSEYHRHVVLPGAIRLLRVGAGDRVLDVACGQGVLCRILHQGGVHATGIDAAGELIDMARRRSSPDIKYIKGDARDLSALPTEHYDAAACILSIQNIHPLGQVFAGVAGRLKPGGRFVLVMMHPCFRGPKATSWGFDEKARVQYRRVDRYLVPRKEPIFTHPGSDPTHYTWTFHRPIESYVKALRNAGLLIDAMEEWPSHKTSEKGPRGEAENRARKEFPMFLAVRALKVLPPATTGEKDEEQIS